MGDIKNNVQKSIFQASNMIGKQLKNSHKTKAKDEEGKLLIFDKLTYIRI